MSDGHLQDGTPYFGRLGRLARDAMEDRVQCHLCGRWLRAVGGAHLRVAHGWTLAEYRVTFQLSTKTPTVARELSAQQRARLIARIQAGEVPGPPAPKPSDQRVWVAPGRSLGALHPDFARELHLTKNGDLDPFRVAPFSLRRLWWRCPACGHEWQTTPQNRVGNGRGCPACAIARRRRRGPVAPGRALARLRPDLATEALDADPAQLGTGSRTRVRWRCSTCGHEWVTTPKKRASEGSGCPQCVHRRLGEGRRAVPYERSLAALCPDLASDVHPTRNPPTLSNPATIGLYTRHQLWWRCQRCGHEWKQTPRNAQRGRGCPACRPIVTAG